jgi:arsenate reductase-like glutaredoxin family protein
LIDESRMEDFINKRSPAYKERNLDARTLSKAEAIRLMMEEPNLIRRPLVLAKGKAVFGYDAEEYERLAKR